ncbi:hypothetical protein C8Q78DRAFT_1030261 [Trametes maxima]|nr:hypothetical protein C8Q78DRAFT_1030261 [Trametes maxima]
MQAAPVLRTNVAPALLYEPPRIPISISLDSYLDQKAIEIPSAAHPSASVKPLFASRTSGTPLTKSEDTGATVDGTEATTKEPECARPLTLNPERVFVPRAHAPSFTPRSQVPPPSTRLSPETRPFHPPQVKQTPQACTSMQTATPPTISIPHQPLINAPPMLLPARASPKNPPPFWAPRPAFPSDAQASTFVPRATAPVFAPQPPAPTQLPTAFPPSVLPPLPFLPRIQAPVFIPKALPTLSAPVFAPRPDAPSFVPRAQVPTFTFVPRLQAPVFVPGAVADKDAAELACAEPPAPTGEAAGGDEDEEGKRRKKKKTRRGGKRAQKQRQRRQAAMRAKAEAKAEAKARATAAVKSGREAGDVSSLSDKRSWAEEVEAAEDEDAESEVEIILELRAVRQVESVEASGLSA